MTWLRPVCSLAALALAACSASGQDSDTPGDTPDEEDINQDSYAGDYALDFLTSDQYPSIYIEIDYMEDDDPNDGVDYRPSEDAVAELISTIEELCDKPGGVVWEPDAGDAIPIEVDSEGNLQTEYTYNEVNGLERIYRNEFRGDGVAVLYFLYLNGTYVTDEGEPTSVIGFAHHGSSMAIFKGVVNGAIPAARVFYETTTARHELGHLLGLVNVGIEPVDETHVDPNPAAAGAHCVNTSCIMYWQVETRDFLAQAVLGQPPTFDDDCRMDIYAAGGKDTLTSRMPAP